MSLEPLSPGDHRTAVKENGQNKAAWTWFSVCDSFIFVQSRFKLIFVDDVALFLATLRCAHWPRFSSIELAHNRRKKLTSAVLMVYPSWSCNWTKAPVAWLCAPGCKRMVCFASRSGTRFTDAREIWREVDRSFCSLPNWQRCIFGAQTTNPSTAKGFSRRSWSFCRAFFLSSPRQGQWCSFCFLKNELK